MIRKIACEIDTTTWPSETPPPEIQAAPKVWNCDMLMALLYAAIWSRPPALHGFSLSDTWAWLRYIPAISNNRQLRLRPEWNDVDAHQKTIMSDDFGVGCSTWWLSEHLNYHYFFETRYFVQQMPLGYYELKSTNKRGPSKAPDFVAFGPRGLAVLECKGTQGSSAALEKAMDAKHGRAQKGAFKTRKGARPKESLVIGLFLAQDGAPERNSKIVVADPPVDNHQDAKAKDAALLLKIALTKVYLAKVLCLLNQPYNASLVLNGDAASVLKMSGREAYGEWKTVRQREFVHQHIWVERDVQGVSEHRVTCGLSYSEEVFQALRESRNVGKQLERLSEGLCLAPRVVSEGNSASMELPLGFKIALTVDGAQG